jgi:hypothetical protein
LTALKRRYAAAGSGPFMPPETFLGLWHKVIPIRREWLHHGLRTEPADRVATEASIAAVYARHARSTPRFVWVESPRQALPLLAGLPTHDDLHGWVMPRRPPGRPPFASDLAAGLSRLRSTLDDCAAFPDYGSGPFARKDGKSWPVLPPVDAIRAGVPFRVILRQGIYDALWTSLFGGICRPVRAELAAAGPLPVAWYGQQDAPWIGYHDALARMGLARYPAVAAKHLADWATLARSCGWWWPGEDVCVVVDRPDLIHAEPDPAGWHDEVRIREPIRYRDGWSVAVS